MLLSTLGLLQGVPPGTIKAPLQTKLQARMGITEQLQAAGGVMTYRKLYNIRRDRKHVGGWDIAMTQLVENGYVYLTGWGRRGDPILVHLLKPLPGLPEIQATE